MNNIIDQANVIVSLKSVLNKYHICLNNEIQAGWINFCCPFPDHKDTNPSFGYNIDKDWFNCYGCKRSGRAVQFISYMENRDFKSIAIEILENKENSDDEYNEIEQDEVEDEFLDELLFSFADDIREFKNKYKDNPKAEKYADDIAEPADLYIMQSAGNTWKYISVSSENFWGDRGDVEARYIKSGIDIRTPKVKKLILSEVRANIQGKMTHKILANHIKILREQLKNFDPKI
jgi:hypothetical protein